MYAEADVESTMPDDVQRRIERPDTTVRRLARLSGSDQRRQELLEELRRREREEVRRRER